MSRTGVSGSTLTTSVVITSAAVNMRLSSRRARSTGPCPSGPRWSEAGAVFELLPSDQRSFDPVQQVRPAGSGKMDNEFSLFKNHLVVQINGGLADDAIQV